MAIELPQKIRNAIEEAQFWHLATTNPDGSPQVTTIWVMPKDGNILINTALGRKKPRNLEQNPNVALSWFDPENPYSTISIQGRVAESYTGDQAEADIDSAAKKYIDKDVYPWRKEDEHRISYLIEPVHISSG